MGEPLHEVTEKKTDVKSLLRDMVRDGFENPDSEVGVDSKDRFIYKRMSRDEQDAVVDAAVSNITAMRYDLSSAIETVISRKNEADSADEKAE